MQKKLLFLSVLSFGVVFTAFAQDAPLKKVFNPNAPALTTANAGKISALNGKLFETSDARNHIFFWDSASVNTPYDSISVGTSTDDIRFKDILTFKNRILYSLTYNGTEFMVQYDTQQQIYKNQGLDPAPFGTAAAYRHLNRVSDEAFIAFDSLNNRLIRFDPDTSGSTSGTHSGFYASKEVVMSGFISTSDVGAIGARRDFEVYYVWDKGDNAIKRFDANGIEGTKFDFDSQTFASGRALTIEAIVVEDNGRIVVAVNDQPSGAAKSLTPSGKRLIFFGGGFQFLGDVELPLGGPRGDYSSIIDIEVDYDGNIYIAQAGDRKIRMLDDFNSPPFNNNSSQFSQVVIKQSVGFYPVTKDMIAFQDWNIEDTVVAIRLYPSISQNEIFSIYYDANKDGIYDGVSEEISFANTDSLDVPLSDIIAGRLVVERDPGFYPPGSILNIFSYKWGDGIGFNPDRKGNIRATFLGNRVTINGVSGADGWRLLAPIRIGLTYAEFLAPLWTQGASGSDLPLGSPNVFTYSTEDEEWNPVTDFSLEMEIGQGIAVFIYEDDDLRTPGVQGGWPKQMVLNTEKAGLLNNENFEYDLVYTSNKSQPEYQGFNLLGNPYSTPYRVINPLFRADSSTQVLTYWEATKNGGTGGYVYRPLNTTSSPSLNNIAQGEGFWIQTIAVNSKGKYSFQGAIPGQTFISKSANSTDLLSIELNNEGFGDRLDIYSSAIEAQKLPSLSRTYHEVYAYGEFGKPLAITAGDFEQELVIPIGIRSTKTDQATLSIDQSGMSGSFQSILIRQELPSGEVESHALGEAPVSISLKREGDKWVHEGNLFLVMNKSQSVSSEEDGFIPQEFKISSYPNPFNPSTNIQYALPEASKVSIEIFNISGQKVLQVLSQEQKQAGVYNTRVDLSNQSSGVYFVRVQANGTIRTQKITLIK